jgi:hypothetical protein
LKAPASNASESPPSRPPTRAGSRAERLVPLALVVLLFLLGLPSLGNYSATWDEALGDFFFGERYLAFFTSLDPRYLAFDANPFPADRSPDLFVSPFKTRPWEYYPFANTLAAACSEVLSRRLRLLDPFDGFHALNLFLGAALILALYAVARPRFGPLAAITAILLLFLSPRVVCDLMANIKDFPTMVLFSLTAVAGFVAVERGSVRGVLGAGALWGLALATKANAVFLPAIPLGLLALGGVPDAWRGRRRVLVLALAAAAALGIGVLVASWPDLWADPVDPLVAHFRYIAHQKFQTRAESVAPPLEALLFTTPLPFLALFAVGLLPIARRARARDRAALLVLIWIAVVVARLHLPGAVNFDGVRHFLEIFPPMALVAGAGASWIAGALAGAFARTLAAPRARLAALAIALGVPVGATSVSLTRAHPFEIAYWNALAGGLGGAQARRLPQACDYWGASYRVGLRWLGEHAERDALLAVPIAEHVVRLVAPLWLRPDVGLAALTVPMIPDVEPRRLEMLRAAARERPVYVMFVLREDWMNALTDDCRARLRPAAQWTLDGAPVLAIYRYTPPG